MINITAWMNNFTAALTQTFGNRILFVGLQGSYGRGEASESSDIDVVAIFDELSIEDVQVYKTMLDSLPYREYVCGFVSGKDELSRWAPCDLFQFYFDTTPIYGNLDELLELIDDTAVYNAIKNGVCNIYHGCIHNLIHTESVETLIELYKSASFVLQAIVYRRTERYVRHQIDLLSLLEPDEKEILETYIVLKKGEACDLLKHSQMLLEWAKKCIINT